MNDQLEDYCRQSVRTALAEDIGGGDLTAGLIPATATMQATVITREAMVMAGRRWVDEVMRQVDERIDISWRYADGDRIDADAIVFTATGPAHALLTAERSALNFLQLLSATATLTHQYVQAVAATGCRILDTRKTIPGLRLAQKYAVTCGGGVNHRIGLFDAILIKENHIASAGSIAAAVAAARDQHPEVPLEVEVESLPELRLALAAAPDRIMLDNFSNDELVKAVALNHDLGKPPAELEASGGITLATIRGVAETGVDFISVGALTKNVEAIDLSMRFSDPVE